LQATSARLAQKFPTARLLPDIRTGQLVVIAPAGVQAAIGRQLGAAVPTSETDNPSAATQHRLENISPQQLEQKISTLLGDRVRITTNTEGTVSRFQVIGENNQQTSLQLNR
ncbi:MAG TPA: hypothetical protein DHW38_12915, partial [Planctomycetaceae bacterium]|nr:hypothetical protein [Planctomycetaceae bacterium]